MNAIIYGLIGIMAGVFGGVFGLGGGIIMVPAMVFVLGMSQHQAQGTTLAIMLPPVFLFAVWRYYTNGHVNVPMAIFASVGLTIGAYIGANYVQGVPDVALKKAFGVLLLIIGIKFIFFR